MTSKLLIATPFLMVYPKTPDFRIKLPKQARLPANRLPHNSSNPLFTKMKNRSVLFLSDIENGCYEFFWNDASFFSITTGWFSVSIQGQKRAMYIPNRDDNSILWNSFIFLKDGTGLFNC
jgi:hypothetical protein